MVDSFGAAVARRGWGVSDVSGIMALIVLLYVFRVESRSMSRDTAMAREISELRIALAEECMRRRKEAEQ